MRKIITFTLLCALCISLASCSIGPFTISYKGNDREEKAEESDFSFAIIQGESDGNMQHVIISDGSGISVGTQPTDSSPSTEVTTPAYDPASLIGTWNTVSRSDKYLCPSYVEFHADGTFTKGESEYTHTSYNPDLFYGQPEGWHAVPMGFPYEYGTYTVNGNIITLTILGDSIEESYDSTVTQTLTIEQIGEESAIFSNDFGTNTYLKNFKANNSDNFIEELCAALGVDMSV